MSKKKYSPQEVQDAKATIADLIKPGATVYTLIRHVSSSGMTRVIDVFVIQTDKHTGESYLRRFSWSAAVALGWTYDRRHEGVKVSGCGMDMAFHLVSSLCYAVGVDYKTVRTESI
jgi:hypothetical protein